METEVSGSLILYEDDLHEAAAKKTGYSNFGDPIYRRGLRALLQAYDADQEPTSALRQFAYGTTLDYLIGRLYAQHGWSEHPHVRSIPICCPLFIAGLARTGTTALHKLLAVDPQFQGLEPWLASRPMMRPPRHDWERRPEYRECAAGLARFYSRVPSFRAVHPSSASEVDECGRVLNQTFAFWGLGALLPSYANWLRAEEEKSSYRYYSDVLRLIGAHEPHRRWLLKDPFHMLELEQLLDVFPDACIIQTHRDPVEAIPSWYSLFRIAFKDSGIQVLDSLGQHLCSYWRGALDHTSAAKQRSPDRFFDVDYRLLQKDPLRVVHSIYERFSLALAPPIEREMLAWVAVNHKQRGSKHQYILDSLDVTRDQICKIFAEYRSLHEFGS